MSPVEYHPQDAVADPVYFTVAEARAYSATLANMTVYPDEAIEAARDVAEQALERACGVAFVSRDASLTTDGNGRTDLLLPDPRPTSVTECSVNGTALDVDDIAALVLYRDGRVYRAAGWTRGRGNVEITYMHGYETLPAFVKTGALALAKSVLVDSPLDARATSQADDQGATTLFADDGSFGIPEADRVVSLYGVGASVG